MLAFLRDRLFGRHPGLTVIAAVALLFLLYQAVTAFVAYTWDAFVLSNVVAVSPEVEGRIATIAVNRNQTVRAGDLLAEIDPRPFRIAVEKATAAVELAQANALDADDEVQVARDRLQGASARQADTRLQQQRIAAIVGSGSVSQQDLDNADRNLDVANAAVASAGAAVAAAVRTVSVRQAAVKVAQAELALAQWNLSRTRLVAPVDGAVSPFLIRAGDYIKVGDPLLAIVTNTGWRVVANMKEQYVATIRPGQTVYVRLASDPWTIHTGTVRSVARGVERPETQFGVLPSVSVDPDWVRLQRRFPVEISLGDLPQRRRLFDGADASVLMFIDPTQSAAGEIRPQTREEAGGSSPATAAPGSTP